VRSAVEGRIWIAPLADYARSNHVERLMIFLHLPDTDTFDSQPAPTAPVFGNERMPFQTLAENWIASRIYSWSLIERAGSHHIFSRLTRNTPSVARHNPCRRSRGACAIRLLGWDGKLFRACCGQSRRLVQLHALLAMDP